jgi:hypothetical protein
MFDKKKQDIINLNRPFDYPTIKKMVLLSFKNISKQVKEYHNDWSCCPLIIDSNCSLSTVENHIRIGGPPNGSNENKGHTLSHSSSSPSSLLLKIRNTTEYLKWRICILKRDNFQCRICHISLKDKRNLRLEVHHLKRFKNVVIQNNITTIQQALECQDLWNVNNGICVCSGCHKYIENIRSTIRNVLSSSKIFNNVLRSNLHTEY